MSALCLPACNSKPVIPKEAKETVASPTPTPTPKPKPFVAYLKNGDLWVIRADGTDERVLAVAAEGETIQDFVWAVDGSRVYYCVGQQLFEIVIETSNIASAGEFTAPPGVTIDRIEMARDGKSILINALDANAAARLFALTIGQREARELAIDQYSALLPQRSPVVRSVGELSVSPNARWVLFKGVAGTGEELFVANAETGARVQITNLYQLGGFEDSVQIEGGRRVMEAAWSSDGRYVIFNPMQSCSETGLCYGRLFLVEAFGGVQLQLSVEMMVNLPTEWTTDGKLLVYDDGSRVVVADTQGFPKALAEGNHPKLQPVW
ncbi:MAG TPA: hypothetical protein PLQ88_32655 [Blastocatellia bacterium]|nr:hypothetical protein [Blastocatellia bacterium]